MKQPIVIIGIGEIGGVFARGFLRLGHPVYPALRSSDLKQLATDIASPLLVLVAVGEADLEETLSNLPDSWRDRAALLQNELLPANWQSHALREPTVISIWFEKKKGRDSKVLISSPVFGPNAQLLHDALGAVDIPANILASIDALLFELVVKNLYIVTTNIAGLKVGADVGTLQTEHEAFMLDIANDVLKIQEWLAATTFDRERLFKAMRKAMDADPQHQCMGRSAPARLKRAIEQAAEAGLEVPALKAVAASI